MNWTRLVLGRLAAGLIVLWGAATFTFLAMHLTDSDPAIAILGGPDALPTPAVVEQVRAEYGLNDPLPVQYARHLTRIATGDFGQSYRLRVPVADAIGEQIGATLTLATLAGVVSLLAALAIATLTAGRRGPAKSAASGVEVVLYAVPNFVIGLGLIFVFGYQLRLLPVAGGDGWRGLVLPVLTLAIPCAAMMAQVLRAELDRVLEQPFILSARARGLSDASVRLRHALRHAIVPLLALAGWIFGYLLGGTVITETLFARRGIGRLMVDSAVASDVPMVTGIVLVSALSYVLVTLIVDLLNAGIDPRARLTFAKRSLP